MVPELVFAFELCMCFKSSDKIDTFTMTMYTFHGVSTTYLKFSARLPRLIFIYQTLLMLLINARSLLGVHHT